MSDEYEDLTEREELPEPIVQWQPTHRPQGVAHSGVAVGGVAAGGVTAATAMAVAVAAGALAVGALAIGVLAIGRLAVGEARFKRLEIDHLVVKKFSILDRR